MGLLGYGEIKTTTIKKYSFGKEASRANCPPKNSLGFQVQLEDLHLKYGILGDEPKNKSTGRNIAWGPLKIFPTGTCGVRDFFDRCPNHRRVLLVIDETQTSYPGFRKAILRPHLPTSGGKGQFPRVAQ
jgi:hypothetical protein